MFSVFLLTANVGSVFENLEGGLQIWLDQIIYGIRSKEPDFVGIHFQETGGKNYVNGSGVIDELFGALIERMGRLGYRGGEGFVDSLIEREDEFTALSSLYFVHEKATAPIAIWNYQEKCFQSVGPPFKLHVGAELDKVHTAIKEKPPLEFHFDNKWSRKGFIRTRWSLSGRVLELVNVHLFHDIDNLISADSFPSEYANRRRATVQYIFSRLQVEPGSSKVVAGVPPPAIHLPTFFFGDFNFRLNTQAVIRELEKEDGPESVELDSKSFSCLKEEERFLRSPSSWRAYDQELPALSEYFQEAEEPRFPPTYPFEEELGKGEIYLRTRVPAWCDRVLFTKPAKSLISPGSTEYDTLGKEVCMGDHKPVYLFFKMVQDQEGGGDGERRSIVASLFGLRKGKGSEVAPAISEKYCRNISLNKNEARVILPLLLSADKDKGGAGGDGGGVGGGGRRDCCGCGCGCCPSSRLGSCIIV